MISIRRAVSAALATVTCAALLAGCGNTFRPTINFQPQPSGDPSGLGHAVVLSTNPAGDGSDTHINVSGDTNVGVVNVGLNPVFLGKALGRAFVINGDNTVTVYVALLPTSIVASQITLPASTSGSIGGGASANGNIYIANSGSNDVSVIPSTQNSVTTVVPVGTQPVMVASNVNGNKAYAINHGSNNVTVIGTQDNSVITTIAVGSSPIWGVMSNDGNDVFIVNQGSGTVSVIDTALDKVITTITVGASPNFAFYDNVRKRVYVSNTGSSTISVIKADSIDLSATPQILPTKLADVPIAAPAISVGAIADGTRAYAALSGCPAGINHTTLLANLASCNGNRVAVIDAVGLFQSKLITVGSGAVSIAPSNDGTRVYVPNAHDGNISIIRTSTDTELMRMAAPLENLSCTNPSVCPATAQTPFMVVTFP